MAILCLICRNVDHGANDCQAEQRPAVPPANGDLAAEERLLSSLTSDEDRLCSRCVTFDIISILTEADVKDELDFRAVPAVSGDGNGRGPATLGHLAALENKKYHVDLGPLRQLVLDGSCPLCRLIFRVFPRDVDPENQDMTYYLKPMRSYNRLGDQIPEVKEELRREYSIYVAVKSREQDLQNQSHFLGDPQDSMVFGTSYTFALSDRTPAEKRPGLSARRRNPLVDISVVKQWLARCEDHHDEKCQVHWVDELLTCRMIDVRERRVVKCPTNAKYVALSYVWGRAAPRPGDLENKSLPQTIEDAITLTKDLGLHYLWVDALCIDQAPSAEKTQQLAMMDIIYACAWLTVVALHGDSGDSGLCGISEKSPRSLQGREVINGREILQLYPTHAQGLQAAKYWTRAWTFQELMLSRRRLMFDQHQMHFGCNLGRYAESINNIMDPQQLLETLLKPELNDFFMQEKGLKNATEKTRLEVADDEYCGLVPLYTARQMTNDSDSLNAFLGIIQQLRKSVLPKGLEWGLPLRDFPQSLRWFHPRTVTPRRRPDFPSWSWTGWEGEIAYSDPLNTLRTQKFEASTDMTVKFMAVDGKALTLEAHTVTLEVRTEPFSDVYIPKTETLLGSLQEGNNLHRNTIPSGTYDFLVVERLRYQVAADRPIRQTICMVLLERIEHLASRKTFVRLYMEPGVDFALATGARETIQLI